MKVNTTDNINFIYKAAHKKLILYASLFNFLKNLFALSYICHKYQI